MRSSHEFRSVKAKIRVLCKQRRIRLEEFMKTFDIHHVKKIKVEQFKRALDVSGLQLTAEEMNTIITKYRCPDEPSFVDYQRFCNLIDKAFTVKGLEGKPELRTSIHNDLPAQKKFALVALSESEQQDLRQAMSKLGVAVRDKGLVLKDVFHDFDRSNAGKVTKPQFVRDLLDCVVLSSNEVNALVKAYGNDLDVNYRALHADISPNLAYGPGSPTGSRSPDRSRRHTAPSATRSGNESQALQDLESALSELTVRDRIRTKNFFVDFDPLRTGKCTVAQFKRCVKLCFSIVSESDLELLVTKYVVGNSSLSDVATKVDYIRFCNCVDGKNESGDNNYDDVLASIAATTLSSSLISSKCSRELRGNLSDSELETYLTMMQRLSNFCAQRRLLIKPSFQDFDKGRREHITVEQFFRVMTMLKLMLEKESERKVMLKRYASAHGDRFINYVTFCYDIEHWEETASRPSSSGSRGKIVSEILSPTRIQADTFETSTQSTETRSISMLMRYIKQTIKRDRIRLEEFYRDFDKLRHGKITFAQFAAGLNAGGLLMSKDEVKLLGDEYSIEGDVDSSGKHWVAWKRFVDDVESVFTVKGLERMPNRDLTDLQTKGEQFGGVNKEKELTRDEERQVTLAIVTMRKAIDRQRMEIKAAFEDFDRSKQGFISATKFDRVLSMFQLLPEGSVARLLVIKFHEQSTVGTSMTLSSICDVNYRAFLQSLEFVGKLMATGEDPTKHVLPGSVAYRQGVYNSGLTPLDGIQRQARSDNVSLSSPKLVLNELRCQLNAKRIRMKEFIAEGDKLRSGEITIAKFHTALNRSGCVLDATDIATLTEQFRSAKNNDKVDWRAFLDALDHQRPEFSADADKGDTEVDSKVMGILTKLRTEVNTRRVHMKPYFQDYDHNMVCRVTKFQFAAVLDMMKVNLKPHEVEALQQAFMVRGPAKKPTNDVNYIDFIQAVDSDYS